MAAACYRLQVAAEDQLSAAATQAPADSYIYCNSYWTASRRNSTETEHATGTATKQCLDRSVTGKTPRYYDDDVRSLGQSSEESLANDNRRPIYNRQKLSRRHMKRSSKVGRCIESTAVIMWSASSRETRDLELFTRTDQRSCVVCYPRLVLVNLWSSSSCASAWTSNSRCRRRTLTKLCHQRHVLHTNTQVRHLMRLSTARPHNKGWHSWNFLGKS